MSLKWNKENRFSYLWRDLSEVSDCGILKNNLCNRQHEQQKLSQLLFWSYLHCLVLFEFQIMANRAVPNILVTGTPGVGKSSISRLLAERTKFTWREVSKLAEEYNCLDEYDPEYQCPFLNEDKLLDIMEGMMTKGGNIVDYHGCEFFPERWFDGVFVVRTNNTTLFDRLTARGYTGKKLEDNVQCEIFETLLEEAQSSYKPEVVMELQNDSEEQLYKNVDTIVEWIERWKEENI